MENDQNEQSIESFIIQFNTFSKLAAEHLILKCKTIVEVKEAMPDQLELFCRRVRLDPKSSTFRKYFKIGTEASWLVPLADRLPASWTTIYPLAVLGQAAAYELMRNGTLHAEMTADQLRAATASCEVDHQEIAVEAVEKAADACIFTIQASELCDQGRLELYCDLMQSAQKYGLTVDGLPEELSERIIVEQEAA
jgi:hypothetical protein